ncbi:unnamed protein product [Gongylonema pulchrum]|uniref:Uncharacterized protein n=1 Tax=Gongylonema pulchrum TaxID=637853 RepID=A0A183CVP4_9BILA|nr:unnamed protein product [Gongylonema pulchrum]
MENRTTTTITAVPAVPVKTDEVLDASSSNLDLADYSLSLKSLRTGPVSLSSPLQLTSVSCQEINKLHWRLPRAGSAPLLPNRNFSFPVRDSGCVTDSADYDQPRVQCVASTSSAIDVDNYQSPHIETESKPQTRQLLQNFR